MQCTCGRTSNRQRAGAAAAPHRPTRAPPAARRGGAQAPLRPTKDALRPTKGPLRWCRRRRSWRRRGPMAAETPDRAGAAARRRRGRRCSCADSSGGSRCVRAGACLDALGSRSGSCFANGFDASHAVLCSRSGSCFAYGLGWSYTHGGHAALCCGFCSCFAHAALCCGFCSCFARDFCGTYARVAAWAPSRPRGFDPRRDGHSLAHARG